MFSVHGVELTPHGFSLVWSPYLLAAFIVSNVVIAVVYFGIPFQLLRMQRRGQTKLSPWTYYLICGFVVACGTTHVMNIVTIWFAWYWIQSMVDMWTAMISYAAACLLTVMIVELRRFVNNGGRYG